MKRLRQVNIIYYTITEKKNLQSIASNNYLGGKKPNSTKHYSISKRLSLKQQPTLKPEKIYMNLVDKMNKSNASYQI